MSDHKTFLNCLAEYNIEPKYQLGQNFIYDNKLLNELVTAALIENGSNVLEVGAGFGTLTEAILGLNPKGHVLSYEIDRTLEPRLTDLQRSYPNFRLIVDDARHRNFSVDAQSLLKLRDDGADPKLFLIGNLPYYITTELMEKALIEVPHAASMSFMVQAEVWQRIKARPSDGKSYGALAVLCHNYGKIERVRELPAAVFYPSPRVDSVFVRLTQNDGCSQPSCKKKKNPLLSGDGQAYLVFVKSLLAARRKTIANNLKRGPFDLGRQKRIAARLDELGLSLQLRAEALEPEFFSDLFYA